uniref:Homing endonuclease LAGLIDADG domain-containing protein n=1 Tax=Cyclocybe aegerita TaxID=1973307 RepID=A0A884P6G6_CYCAE|nr:hypothetical protein K4014_mgp33 [Cyclocybe aegerita]QQP21443.1 hypothetical protein [Cyclocybe aegerita]
MYMLYLMNGYYLSPFGRWILKKAEAHKKTRFSPKGNTIINWGFQTISHQAFNPLADLFINNNIKSIKEFLIKDHLTDVGLTYWFMDDGGKLDYLLRFYFYFISLAFALKTRAKEIKIETAKNKSIVLNTPSVFISILYLLLLR